ncbi:MAG: DMT family transporter [Lachnospiraceae bacterium]|nr:DMT family transporter [Lachnospiraceae bacterium]
MSTDTESKKAFLSYVGLFAVAIMWGSAFAVVKNALDTVPPAYMVAVRFTIALAGMLVIFGKRLRNTPKHVLIHGLIIGACLFLAYLVQTIGCNYTTAGKNAFLTAVYIIIVPFLHWILKKKRPEIKLFVAAVIGLIGIGLISLDGDLSIGIGDLLTLICGFLFAMQIAFQDIYVKEDDPAVICLIEMAVCTVGGWICAPVIDGPFPKEAFCSPTIIGSMIYLGLVSSLLCQLLQSVCQRYSKPENASLIMSTESVFGALSSVIFLHERMGAKVLIGCVVMTIAIVLSQIRLPSLKTADEDI